jgi:hypothetical protein
LGSEDSLEKALAVGDQYVRKTFRWRVSLLEREPQWHHEPASEKQLQYLKALTGDSYADKSVTKGQAMKLINEVLNKQQAHFFNARHSPQLQQRQQNQK